MRNREVEFKFQITQKQKEDSKRIKRNCWVFG